MIGLGSDKNGVGKDVDDLFVNFALTPRRAALLYEVRQLKRTRKIAKFYTDCDGSITVVNNDSSLSQLGGRPDLEQLFSENVGTPRLVRT